MVSQRPKGQVLRANRTASACPVCEHSDMLEYLKESIELSKKAGKRPVSPDTLWRVSRQAFLEAGFDAADLPSRYAFRKHFGERGCPAAKLYREWT